MNQTTNAQCLSFLLRFEKKGLIRFISHLDLTRAFHRAFSRAEIPLRFSEGFSPHPKFAFALPLSVGVESECEWAAFSTRQGYEITPDELRERLAAQMPQGLNILSVEAGSAPLSEIAFCSYEIRLPQADPQMAEAAREALSGPLVIQKKNKKGKWVEKEISGGIHSLSLCEEKGGLLLQCILSAAGEDYLKPESLLAVLEEKLPKLAGGITNILRKEVYRADLTPFGAETPRR